MTGSIRYSTPAAFRMALEERLRQAALGKDAVWLVQQRRRLVFDRLLARLLVAAPDRWILKGAVALDFRLGARARATMDLDLAHIENAEAATFDLLTAQATDLGDFFAFHVERTRSLGEAAEGTVRYRVRAELDDRRFEVITLDIGFTDSADFYPDWLDGPDLFGFAGIPPINVPALPLEQHVAEKLHAYTRDYGGRQSTRVKDLVDLVLIESTATFHAARLLHAIDHTFGARGTQTVPGAFPPPPEYWETPYRRLAGEIGIDPDFDAGHAVVASFLDPVLAGTVQTNARWDPTGRTWTDPNAVPPPD